MIPHLSCDKTAEAFELNDKDARRENRLIRTVSQWLLSERSFSYEDEAEISLIIGWESNTRSRDCLTKKSGVILRGHGSWRPGCKSGSMTRFQ
jgi:hypothetical protein